MRMSRRSEARRGVTVEAVVDASGASARQHEQSASDYCVYWMDSR